MSKIPEYQLVKLASKAISQLDPSKGYKLSIDGTEVKIKFSELVKELSQLSEILQNSSIVNVKYCATCKNFGGIAKNRNTGYCFPKDYTIAKKGDDYCSKWVPMTEEQRHIRSQSGEFNIEVKDVKK